MDSMHKQKAASPAANSIHNFLIDTYLSAFFIIIIILGTTVMRGSWGLSSISVAGLFPLNAYIAVAHFLQWISVGALTVF